MLYYLQHLCTTKVSTTSARLGNTGNLSEFEIPYGNTGNLSIFATILCLLWSLLNRFRTEQGHCGACRRKGDLQTLICVLVVRPRRCLTLSNPVPWQNWMVAYLGYILQMKTLFRDWPVMVNDTHTRRRRREFHIVWRVITLFIVPIHYWIETIFC